MHRLLKLFLKAILTILILFLGFYFWASSPNYDKEDYSKILEFNHTDNKSNDSIFSIVTYNIGYLSGMTNNLPVKKNKSFFDDNLNLVLTQFKKINPDIVAFQEIDFDSKRSYDINQQNEIAKLGYNHIAQNVNWDKKYLPFPEFPISMHYGRILSGQSILSKYKIIEQERIELVRNPNNPFYYDAFYLDRLAQIVKMEIPGDENQNRTLIVINVHTEAFDQETRIKQIEKIIELYNQFNKEYATVLLGDFNSDISYENSGIKLIMNLPNTGCAAFNKNQIQNTFDSKKPFERLDYIFYNTDFIEMINAKVLTELEQASDHLPVLMNFKFK